MYKVVDGKTLPMTDDEIREQRAHEAEAEQEMLLSMSYAERVEYLIRKRYTISDELAILRQREDKPEEFEEYNEFAEECKRIAAGSEP